MRQLLLFNDPMEEVYARKVQTLLDKYDSLRKSQFAKISYLEKQLKETKEKLDFLESYICKGSYVR